MEIIFYYVFTMAWWASSLTVFLPLLLFLKVNKKFRDFWFAIFWKILGASLGARFIPLRKSLFKILEDRLTDRDKSKPLEVLEIGIGGGANLEYYPENSNLTAIDTNETFLKIFNESKSKYPQVSYKRTILGTAEQMTEIEDSIFDVVLSTHVLCSVSDVESVLKEVKRVLKPGGMFVFWEHQAFPKNNLNYMIQLLGAPLWKIYMDGCHILRNIGDSIDRAGFTDVSYKRIYPSIAWMYFRPQVLGVATK